MEVPIKNKRIEYLDAMRGFTMILVVYAHVLLFSFGFNSDSHASFNQFFMLMRMPLFFFISGFIFYKDINWTLPIIRQFILKKSQVQLLSTLIVYTIFIFVFQKDFWEGIMTQTKYGYWFTITLFEFFLLILIPLLLIKLTKIKGGGSDVILIIFTIGIFLLSLQPINTKLNLNIKIIDILGLLNWKYFIYFTFGILVKKHFTLFQQLIDHKTIYMVIMVALFVISYICLLRMSYSENIWDKRIDFMLRIIVAILAIIVTFAIFRHYQNLFSKQKKIGRILQFIGTHTLDIYLLHYILIPQNLIMIGRFFQTNVNPLIEFTITVILALLIIAACLTISTIIRTSPILSTLVFGIKPKSKN